MNQTYWTDLTIIVQDELRRLRQRDTIEDATTHRQGIHAAVASDVSAVFQNKSLAELNKLQLTIEAKLSGPTTGLDVGYWESLLSQLKGNYSDRNLKLGMYLYLIHCHIQAERLDYSLRTKELSEII